MMTKNNHNNLKRDLEIDSNELLEKITTSLVYAFFIALAIKMVGYILNLIKGTNDSINFMELSVTLLLIWLIYKFILPKRMQLE
jgi:hypothetical protein